VKSGKKSIQMINVSAAFYAKGMRERIDPRAPQFSASIRLKVRMARDVRRQTLPRLLKNRSRGVADARGNAKSAPHEIRGDLRNRFTALRLDRKLDRETLSGR
jgi:hypothetical protein